MEKPPVAQMLIVLLVWVGMTQADLQEKLVPACRKFLYMSVLPQGFQGPELELICQYYRGQARFVTLYDTRRRIPVFSAYTFKRSDGSRKVDVPWMYEPQVVYWEIFFLLVVCFFFFKKRKHFNHSIKKH